MPWLSESSELLKLVLLPSMRTKSLWLVKTPQVPQLLTSLLRTIFDVAARDRPDAGPIDVPARVIHREAVYDDVAGPFEVDPIRSFAIAALDDGPRIGPEGDRLRRGPALGEVPAKLEPRVRPGPDDDGVAGIYQARSPLDRPEGRSLRARSRIAPVRRNVVRAAGCRGNLRGPTRWNPGRSSTASRQER
jgi:hypothetical protein